jgi:V/A-type H+-transporting ATPase subunit I
LVDEFQKKVGRDIDEIEVMEVDRDDKDAYVLVTLSKEKIELFEEKIFEFNFEEVDLPQEGKTPRHKISEIEKEVKKNKKRVKELKSELKKISKKELKNLKVVYDYLTWQKDIDEAKVNFDLTAKAFKVTAWIQKENIESLKVGMKSITTDFDIQEVEPGKKEKTPVLIENRSYIKPFETVTKIYGLPKKDEVDPTPFLAPFFIVYFALCLTDAGYGLILAIGTFLAIKIFKIPREKQRLLRLLCYGGIVTFFIGALYGGWFGIEMKFLPGFLTNIQVINPLEDVMTVLGVAAILGFIQILTGIAIKLSWSYKNKDFSKEVIIDGLWFIILFSGAAYLLFTQVVIFSIGATAFLILLLVAAAVVVWLSGTNIFKKKIDAIEEKEGKSSKYYSSLILWNVIGSPIRIVSGILGLYTIVGYVSDVLSYSRLLALGLATGIIAMAINIIAVLVKDMIPYVGYVVMVLVLIGGHTFNIAINVLGAYIHSGRLQFVEFFPKFLEGGGEVFLPFKREGKYIEIIA